MIMYPRFNNANHFTGFLLRVLYPQLAYPAGEHGIYDPAKERGIYDPLSFPPSSTVVLV